MGFPGGSVAKKKKKKDTCQCKRHKRSEFDPCQEDPPEKGMATHSSILAWEIPWKEDPGRLQLMGLQSDITEAT